MQDFCITLPGMSTFRIGVLAVARISVVVAILLAVTASTPARAAFITIDQFSDGTTDLNLTAVAPPTLSASQTETGLSGVAGGSRRVDIQKVSGLLGSTRNVTGAVDAPNQQFAYISGNGVVGTMTLTYDANGAGLNAQLGLIDTILLNFVDGDYSATRNIPVTITITASNNQTGSLTQTLAVEQSPYVMEFAIASFSNLGGLNLASNTVKSLQMHFAPIATSADFTLASIQVVPEPSSYALAIIGAVAAFGVPRFVARTAAVRRRTTA